MSETKPLLSLVQAFFQDYLAGQRGLSQNTILAYRDALKLFLAFLAGSSGRPAAQLRDVYKRQGQYLTFLKTTQGLADATLVLRRLHVKPFEDVYKRQGPSTSCSLTASRRASVI